MIIVLIRTAAEVTSRLNGISIRHSAAYLSVVHVIAGWDVDSAAYRLRGVDCEIPVCERAACGDACCGARITGGGSTGASTCGIGRI